MINEHYLSMLSNKSVIRNLSEYATARGKEIEARKSDMRTYLISVSAILPFRRRRASRTLRSTF